MSLHILAKTAVRAGRWGIRHVNPDNPCVSYGGFRWKEPGEWTEAPDWSPEPECGGGLHLQLPTTGGDTGGGGALALVEYDGDPVLLEIKAKVRRARLLLVGAWTCEAITSLGQICLNLTAGAVTLPNCTTARNVWAEGGSTITLPNCTSARDIWAYKGGAINLPKCTTARDICAYHGGAVNLPNCVSARDVWTYHGSTITLLRCTTARDIWAYKGSTINLPKCTTARNIWAEGSIITMPQHRKTRRKAASPT